MAKTAVKQVWRHPETRLAFVYFADADTGAALNSLDGYTVSEAGSNINAPIGTQSASAQSAPAQEQPPVNTSLTDSEARGGGEFIPVDKKAKAKELLSMPNATQDPDTGIIKVPTPSSGGFMAYDPKTGWSAYTNKDGITTTFDAQGNILGGPGLAPQLGTKSGSAAMFEDIKNTPVIGAILGAVLNPVGTITKAIVDRIMGQEGTRNPNGSVTYSNIVGNEGVSPSVGDDSYKEPIDTAKVDPFTGSVYEPLSTTKEAFSERANAKGDFSGPQVSSFGDDALASRSNTTPEGFTSRGFLGTEGVTQGFYGRNETTTKNEFSGPTGYSDKDMVSMVEAAAKSYGFDNWSKESTAAVVGTFAHENGAWVSGKDGKPIGWDASRNAFGAENSIGFGMWNGSRIGDLKSFAESKNKSFDDAPTQLDFFFHEITTNPMYAKTKEALNDPTKPLSSKVEVITTNFSRPLAFVNPKNSRITFTQELSRRNNAAKAILGGNYNITESKFDTTQSKDIFDAIGSKGFSFNDKDPLKSIAESTKTFTGFNVDNVTNRSLQGFYNDLTPEQKDASRAITNENVKSINFGRGFVGPQGLFDNPIRETLDPSFYSTMQNFMGDVPSSRSLVSDIANQGLATQDNRTSNQKALDNLGFTVPTTPISMPTNNFLEFKNVTTNNRNPTAISNLGLFPNPVSVSTFTPQPPSTVPQGFYGQEGGIPQINQQSQVVPIGSVDGKIPAQPLNWAQEVAGNIIGWAIDKTLADSRPQERATQALAPSSGFMGSSPASFRDAQNEQIREGLQLKDDLIKELSGKNAFQSASSSFGPAVNSTLSAWDTYARENDLMTSRQAGVAAMSGIYDTVYDTLRTLNNNYQATRNFDKVKDMAEEISKQNSARAQPVSSRSFDPRSMYDQPMDSEGRFGGLGDRSVFSDIGGFAQSTFQTSQERQAAEIAAQAAAAAANYGGGSVSTAGPSGGFDSGVYSGPSGWESSGGGGVWDSLGSGSAIDYGGGGNYGGGGWASSAGSATGTAGSGVSSAGSSGTGTAGSASGGVGLSGAASGAGTAGGSSGGFNSAPGSTSGGYGGYGGWSGDGGWW